MTNTVQKLEEIFLKQLERADGALDKAVEFTANESPKLIEEFFIWHSFLHIGLTVLFLTFIIIATTVIIKKKKQLLVIWRKNIGDGALNFFTVVFYCAFYLVMLILFFCHLFNSVKIILTPRLYLVEWVAEQIK